MEEIFNERNVSMKIIDLGRGAGKTTHIVKLSGLTQYPILCLTNSQRNILLDRAKEWNIQIPKPILWDEYAGQDIPYVLIDEAFIFLNELLKRTNDKHKGIYATSFSSEEYCE